MTKKWAVQIQQGCKAGFPVFFGYIPVGIAYGMMGIQAGMSIWQVCALSLFVYTGAGQMSTAAMLALHASVWTIWITIFLLNLRHIIMSTVVMDRLRKLPLFARLFLAFGITDEVFAVFVMEDQKQPSGWYFLGLSLISWLGWNIGSCIGACSSVLFPASVAAALNITLYALFIALLVPGIKKSRRLLCLVLLSCLLSWLLSQFLSSSATIILTSLLAAGAGTMFVKKEDVE